LTTKTDITRS